MPDQRISGFLSGFSAPFGAVRTLLSMPRAWPYALVPAAVFVLLEGAFVAVSWQFLKPWAVAQAGSASWVPSWLGSSVGVLAVLLAAALGWFASALLAPAFSAPALERLVGLVEDELRAPSREPLGFFAELGCGLRSMLFSLSLTLPLVLGLTLLEMLLPPVAVVATPLKLLLGAFGVAWGLFDYPLTLRGVRARDRFGFLLQHFSVVLGFGIAFTLVFWLPCFGILMLPVGVIAATRLYWQIRGTAGLG
jgi:uncharacterized protein involved in cysteine biosynthesis